MIGKDSLKVVVVGNEGVGKTSLIQRLVGTSGDEERNITESTRTTTATKTHLGTPSLPSTTTSNNLVGLSLYEWDLPDAPNSDLKKITLWDFTGSHDSFHAVHEMFFTPETLYVVVWDMAANDIQPREQERFGSERMMTKIPEPPPLPPAPLAFGIEQRCSSSCSSAFRLDYDSDTDSDNDCDMDLYNQEEIRKLKRSLVHDIDQKVQVWIDRIQARVPGATILPVATFADRFWMMGSNHNPCKQVKKRCYTFKERLLCHEACRVQDLEYRLKISSLSAGGHKETCRWHKSLSERPQILFGAQQNDGQSLPHFVSSLDGTGLGSFRDFLLAKARALAAPTDGVPFVPQVTRSLLRTSCRRMMNDFKVVQAHYFLEQYEKEAEGDTLAALHSLHRSGEVCYFGEKVFGTKTDFVILDPVWMVDSVDFILRNGLHRYSGSSILRDRFDNSCRPFEDTRQLWKDRQSTQLNLELAQQMSGEGPDRVFDMLIALLTEHDIVVPQSFGDDSKCLFVPSFLSQRDYHDGCESSCALNCPLTHLGSSGMFSHSLCHGLTFMERVPAPLMERILLYTTKSLDSHDNDALQVVIKEFHCWKDSCRIKLEMTSGNEEQSLEVQSFLLQAPEIEDAPCYAVSCKSMLVTCIKGCHDAEKRESWKQICLNLRRAMQNALDEMPGIEYRDEGICPECLTTKSVGEIGTWSFTKIRNVLEEEKEGAFLRCRNGHCADIALLQGLISCNFDSPGSDFSCCKTQCSASNLSSKCSNLDSSTLIKSLGVRSLSDDIGKVKPCTSITRSQTLPTVLVLPVPASVHDPIEDEFDEKLQEVKKLIQAYEANSSKKRFFGRKKPKLVLSNLGLRENHLPVKDLLETPICLSLQSLSLSNNLLERVPEKLVLSLPSLKSLDLSRCSIVDLPKTWKLPKLKKLNLSNNLLLSFPGEAMLQGMMELEELNLSGNKIKKVKMPSDPQILGKLKALDLSMNEITKLPTIFGRLPSLTMFDIQHNPIKEVPVGIVSSMNSFVLDSVMEKTKKSHAITRDDGQRVKKVSLWNRSSSRDEGMPHMKETPLSRMTQNTIPVEDHSDSVF